MFPLNTGMGSLITEVDFAQFFGFSFQKCCFSEHLPLSHARLGALVQSLLFCKNEPFNYKFVVCDQFIVVKIFLV